MDVDVRPITPDELAEFRKLLGLAFGFDPSPDELERFERGLELDRTRAAFDGDEMVGTSGAFSLDLTVPGGFVPCGGTTEVTVKPTHRRRGILRQMMRAHLDDVASRHEPIAALWASDSGIYGRFGYGMATETAEVTVPHLEKPLHRLAPEPASVELVDLEAARLVLPRVFDEVRHRRPGFYARSDTWWEDRHFYDPERHREGATAQRFAVALSVSGEPEGYVRFRVAQKWEEGHGAGEIRVLELVDATPEAAAGLWSFLLGHDLVAEVKAERPSDDTLPWLLAAPRRARRVVGDGLWVRVLDVPAALEARRYRAPGTVTFEISDPLGRVDGRYRLEVAEDGTGRCRPTDDRPDLVLDVEDLGASYLGAPRFAAGLRAGRMRGDQAAAVAADLMFGWDPSPWCPEVF